MSRARIVHPRNTIPPGEKYKWPENTEDRILRAKITPNHPLNPPYLHGFSTPTEQYRFNRALILSHSTEWDDWKLVPGTIAFKNEREKEIWTNCGFHDYCAFQSFTNLDFWGVFRRHAPQTIAVFSACTESLVANHRNPEETVYKRVAWHTWVVVLRPIEDGSRDLFIYDSDHIERGLHFEDFTTLHLTVMQQHLIKHLQQEGLQIRNIFLHGDKYKGHSTELAGEFVRSLVTKGNRLPIPWDLNTIQNRWNKVVHYESPIPTSDTPVVEPAREMVTVADSCPNVDMGRENEKKDTTDSSDFGEESINMTAGSNLMPPAQNDETIPPRTSNTPPPDLDKQLCDTKRELQQAEITHQESELASERKLLSIFTQQKELEIHREEQAIEVMKLENLRSRVLNLTTTLERSARASPSTSVSGSHPRIRKERANSSVASAGNEANRVM